MIAQRNGHDNHLNFDLKKEEEILETFALPTFPRFLCLLCLCAGDTDRNYIMQSGCFEISSLSSKAVTDRQSVCLSYFF